jgi:apolipoprotein N-acyltransferase
MTVPNVSVNTRKNILLALSGGLLLGLPWSVPEGFVMVFFAWVPLLIMEADVRHHQNPYAVFNIAFVGFLLWNILGTWWIIKAQFVGAILIILTNAL